LWGGNGGENFTTGGHRGGIEAAESLSEALVLSFAAGGGPVGKGSQSITVLPGELEESACSEIGGFLAKEGFKTPLNIGAVPGMETVTAGGQPVELEQVEHGRGYR